MRSLLLILLVANLLAVMPEHSTAASAGQTPDGNAALIDVRARGYLLKAAEDANLRQVKYLLERGANPDVFDAQTRRLLMEKAVGSGDIETVKVLLASSEHYTREPPQSGWRKNDHAMVDFLVAMHGLPLSERKQYLEGLSVKVSKPDYNWDNEELFVASRKGDADAMHRLLASGADPNAVNIDGDAPLTLSAQNGHIVASKILLAAGGDINGPGPEYKKPATVALVNRQETMQGFLASFQRMTPEQREEQLRPYTPDPEHGRTALYPARGGTEHLNAPSEGFPAGSRPGDVRFNNANRTTTLMNAAKLGDIPALDAYLKQGAALEAREDNTGFTALMYAAAAGQYLAVQRLLEAGADVNAKNSKGATALMEASIRGRDAAIHSLLTAPGIDIEARDSRGRTALMLALDYRNTGLAEILLKKGVDPNVRDAKGRTPLLKALLVRDVDAFTSLVKYKADLNIADNSGLTILVWAVRENDVKLAELLLQLGANVRVKLPDGLGLESLVEPGSDMAALLASYGLKIPSPPVRQVEFGPLVSELTNLAKERQIASKAGPEYVYLGRQDARKQRVAAEERERQERERQYAAQQRQREAEARQAPKAQQPARTVRYVVYYGDPFKSAWNYEHSSGGSSSRLTEDPIGDFSTEGEARRLLEKLYNEVKDSGYFQARGVDGWNKMGFIRKVER